MAATLLDSRYDTDACGVGVVAALDGRPSREVLDRALVALTRLSHRGAVASDGRSSDGVGILTQIPRAFFGADGVAMLFLNPARFEHESAIFARLITEHGFVHITWRDVPIDPSLLGPKARDGLPKIRQALAAPASHEDASRARGPQPRAPCSIFP